MIGWYVHDHGSGHRRRLEAVAPHLGEPVTGMGSGEPANGVEWLALPRDTGSARTDDPTAGGALHWAPRGESGMLGRAEAVAAWARRTGCRLLVVDVSVEMLLLGRLLGLPTVAVLQPGVRDDPAHHLGYATAAALLAPWPRTAHGGDEPGWAGRTRWTGAFSRFDGRPPAVPDRGCPPGRCAVLAVGTGGHGVRGADVRAAALTTTGWHWHVAGELEGAVGRPDEVVEHGHVADVWPLLSGADVVVGPCGGGLTADVAAAGVPFLALPQPRPFDEQVELARLLRTAGVAETADAWPAPARWPALLDRLAADRDAAAARWRTWSDGAGAVRAAAVVREVAASTVSSAAPPPVRVVHVPADHDYVRHATTVEGAATPASAAYPVTAPVVDPPVRTSQPDLPPFRWRDGRRWLAEHGAAVDVLHVHFGFESVGVEELSAVLDAADDAGVRVVWTVHDLQNPHLVDQAPHEAQLALLARRAAGLLTLTPGAADEVARRFGRRPVVVRHPHLAPPDVLGRARTRPAERVVGCPLGLLRPGTDPAVVRALLGPQVREALADLGPATLRVTLRQEVLEPGFPRPDADLVAVLRRAHDDGLLDLQVGPRTPAERLWPELAGLSALVLPYRWGTHSGWVEACHDVGTPVVAPALGRWAEQHEVHAFPSGPAGPDPAALAGALSAALRRDGDRAPVLAERLHERAAVAAEHARLHTLAAAGGRW
ncbi:hypothetical protein [Aquipuribacter sp. SD81]|uniref:hypothetical protein n=1 Tax=Aquipuribacter sp. SD81 TaxID=3127703 RepID=UPI0030162191